jgi:hypothetical protein
MQAVLLRSDFLVRRSALPVRTSALSGCASRSSILSLQLHAGEVRCVVLRLFGSCEGSQSAAASVTRDRSTSMRILICLQ